MTVDLDKAQWDKAVDVLLRAYLAVPAESPEGLELVAIINGIVRQTRY